jgi:hypothetical protein
VKTKRWSGRSDPVRSANALVGRIPLAVDVHVPPGARFVFRPQDARLVDLSAIARPNDLHLRGHVPHHGSVKAQGDAGEVLVELDIGRGQYL